MKIKKWNKTTHKYEDCEVPEGCLCYSNDMEQEVTCPHCGKKIKVEDGYTSNIYYEPNGIWGMIVCEECYFEE